LARAIHCPRASEPRSTAAPTPTATCDRPLARRHRPRCSNASASRVSLARLDCQQRAALAGTTTSTVIAMRRLLLAPEGPEVRRPTPQEPYRQRSKGATTSTPRLLLSVTAAGTKAAARAPTAIGTRASIPIVRHGTESTELARSARRRSGRWLVCRPKHERSRRAVPRCATGR
jgi:hypothetical protein